MNPKEALDEFYKLKNDYEINYFKSCIKPILKDKGASKKLKHFMYKHGPKPKCINCERNVGTTFIINKTQMLRNFYAKCGDVQNPCALDIHIQLSTREQYYKFITESLKLLNNIKLNIIKQKNNAIFFNENVEEEFEKLTNELKDANNIVGIEIETNILKNDNPEKRQLLKRLVDEFGIGCILPFKQMVHEYMENNDEIIINNAVKFYIEEIIPKLKVLQEMKYDVSYVDFNEEDNINKLIQLPNSLENMELFYEQDDKVIKFVTGNKQIKQKKKSKPKTLKKELLLPQEEQEQQAQEQQAQEQKKSQKQKLKN